MADEVEVEVADAGADALGPVALAKRVLDAGECNPGVVQDAIDAINGLPVDASTTQLREDLVARKVSLDTVGTSNRLAAEALGTCFRHTVVARTLLPHQRTAIAFITGQGELRRRLLLHHSTGSGKTRTAIVAAICLILSGTVKTAVFVTTKSVLA